VDLGNKRANPPITPYEEEGAQITYLFFESWLIVPVSEKLTIPA
jgi:hypothetical protein